MRMKQVTRAMGAHTQMSMVRVLRNPRSIGPEMVEERNLAAVMFSVVWWLI